jgi:hypothetical protein
MTTRRGAGTLLGAAVFLLSIVGTGAEAQQTPGSPGLPQQRLERQDERTESAREAESYDAKGVRVGSFLLFPALELDEVFNDNVFAQSAGSGPTASFIQVIKPTLELRSTWATHMLNVYARSAIGFYTNASALDYQDVSVGTDGRIDIQRNWNIYGGFSFNRKHEDPGLPNTVTGPTNVTIYNQLSGSAGYYQKVNRFSGRAEFFVDNYTYFDNGLGLAEGVVPNTDRNRTELRESLRFGYEFLDGYEFWVRGSLNQRMYNTAVDATGFARNSNGWDVVGGITLDLGGLISAEAFAGYLQQNYVNQGTPPLQGPMFGLLAHWNPLKELWFRPYVKRTVNEAAFVGDSGYLNTSMGFTTTYNLQPNVQLGGLADYTIADYQSFQSFSSTDSRYDQYVTLGASIMYTPVRQFFVGPSYQYVYRTSNQPGLNYSQNVIMLRLGARL